MDRSPHATPPSHRPIKERMQIALHESKQAGKAWMEQHPLLSLGALTYTEMVGSAPGWFVRKLTDSPAWREYQGLYMELEKMEDSEGYPSFEKVRVLLDRIRTALGPCTQQGYYPFAGSDLYIARLFSETVFEDIAYGKKTHRHMWFPPEYYSMEKLREIEALLRARGFLAEGNQIWLVPGNAERKRADRTANVRASALVVKGGHATVPFLQKRFGSELLFGALVLIDPHDREETLNAAIVPRRYALAFQDRETRIIAPFAMPYEKIYVYRRRDTLPGETAR